MAQTLRLLLLEDDDTDAELTTAALRRGGLDMVIERAWSREGMEQALSQRWDAVISDYVMPQFSALAALALIKSRGLDLPFIIVSGAVGEQTAVDAMKAGAHDYVYKGDLSRLTAALEREIAEARLRQHARLAEANLRNSETLLNSIVNTAADGIIVVAANGTVEFANPAVERMFGYKPLELMGRGLQQILCIEPGKPVPWLPAPHGRGLNTELRNREFEALRRDGGNLPVEVTANPMRIDGELKATIVLRDTSERKRSEARIRQLAHYDELTGLPNRALLTQLLERALDGARQKDQRLAVMFIDLDRFKIVNDTLGHHVGDDVLKQVAARLAAILSRSDSIARLGGDEFVVLMRQFDNTQRVGEMAQRILDTLAAPFILDGQEYHLSGSVGVSTYPDDSNDAQTLLRNADIAMYRAKESGKNAYQFHSAQMNVHSFERLVLERFLRRALEHDEFLLHYQPQIEAATGRVIGMEALLRWQNPAMGLISPAKFIPIAEETGLIVPIGEAVLRRACEDTIAWERLGLGPLRVAVNLSAHQLADERLMDIVRAALEQTQLDPSHLELEITESVVMQNADRAAALLRELRAMGLHLAIDDFGTGYSSLGYLKRFPVNTVKIDRSFITDIPGDPDDIAITRAVIAMAHSLRLQVTAEGVETHEQLDFLAKLGCEQMQGYFFSKPLPAETFENWLRERRQLESTAGITVLLEKAS